MDELQQLKKQLSKRPFTLILVTITLAAFFAVTAIVVDIVDLINHHHCVCERGKECLKEKSLNVNI